VGFAVPSRVTTDAVRSYRTVSPLPVPRGTWAVCSLLHFPWAHAPQVLPGTRSAGARTFLHRSEASAATARPTLIAHDTAARVEVKWQLCLNPRPGRCGAAYRAPGCKGALRENRTPEELMNSLSSIPCSGVG